MWSLRSPSWSEEEKWAHNINAKAINVLYCALNEINFNKVSLCTTTKEIYDLLEFDHEGTSQVKESEINLLTHKYEFIRWRKIRP